MSETAKTDIEMVADAVASHHCVLAKLAWVNVQATISRLITIEAAAKTVIRLMHDWATPDILGVRMRDALVKLEAAMKEDKR